MVDRLPENKGVESDTENHLTLFKFRETDGVCASHLLIYSPNAQNTVKWPGRSQELGIKIYVSHAAVRTPYHMSQHFLPPKVCVSRNLRLGVGLGLEPPHFSTKCVCECGRGSQTMSKTW